VTICEYVTAGVTNAFSKGGPVANGFRLELLFWGDYWQTNASLVSDLTQAISDILASPYLSELSQYGVNSISQGNSTIVLSPGPPAPSFSGGDATDMVWALIDDGKYAEGAAIIYMIFAPPGTSYGGGEAGGAHTVGFDPNLVEDVSGALLQAELNLLSGESKPLLPTARVGWVNFATFDAMTAVFTHELVEMLVDPDVWFNRGWITDSTALGADLNEIADVCLNQVGMAGGHRVSAYYSDRLKKCVVPMEVLHRSLSLSMTNRFDRPLLIERGSTTVERHNHCYSGAYNWTLWEGEGRATITADVSTFVDPLIAWTVNDEIINGVKTIKADVSVGADPLSVLTSMPPETATLTCTTNDRVLIIDDVRQGQCWVDVRCQVSESSAAAKCVGACVDEVSFAIAGRVRVMDDRFDEDRRQCQRLAHELARNILRQQVIPRIPEGDPPPPWVGRQFTGVAPEVAADIRYSEMMAQFLERADPTLAEELRVAATLAIGAELVAAARGHGAILT
jgi:hypothetical protein